MKKSIIKQLSLYNYRYLVGYASYAVLLVLLLLLYVTILPRGLSGQEIASATHSATSSIQNILFNNPIDAPYVLLQKASLHFFGLTVLAVKLPSLILAFITGMSLVFMLRQWFSDNVAVLTSITVATSGPFMTMGRTGTAVILYAFWLSLILLAATKKLSGKEKTFKWKLIFFMAAAGSLYTPMMIYPIISIAIAGLLHPHIRFAIRHISLKKLAVVIAAAIVVLVPLVIATVHNASILNTLLGFPENTPTLDTVKNNFLIFISVFFNFGNIQISNYILPLFNAATVVIVLLGVMRTLVDRYSARSYMLLIWSALSIILILFNPVAVSVLYIPIVLFLAVGVETLIREWYRLFPRNPYARIAALIPLTILLVSISTSDVARYFYGYMYVPDTKEFHAELSNIRSVLDKPALKGKPVVLITTKETTSFYNLLQRNYKYLTVTDTIPTAPNKVITESRYSTLNPSQQQSLLIPYRLITTGNKTDGLLLRVYLAQ